ncbi:uncharacterized protein LOC143282929 [Babylonia areolata]|uniref:uncharacterized protein LOC143282929 n=1 Tax=Babylonia areolata TaxID=304850 RepID=UPI003FCFFD83
MTLSVVHVLLPCLVAMAAAAPAPAPAEERERASNQEQPVRLTGDSGQRLDLAKRAKEEVVFGNQQNGANPPAAKKAMPDFHYPPFMPPQALQLPEAGMGSSYPYPAPDYDSLDKAGYMYASEQKPVAGPLVAAPGDVSGVLGEGLKGEQVDKEKEMGDQKASVQSATVNKQEEVEVPAAPTDEAAMGGQKVPPQPSTTPVADADAESEEGEGEGAEGEEAEQQRSPPKDGRQLQPVEGQTSAVGTAGSPAVVVPEAGGIPLVSRLPEDSRKADAEEAFQADVQTLDKDDIESFLQDLKESSVPNQTGKNQDMVEMAEGEKEKEEEEEEEEKGEGEEGSVEEAELLKMAANPDTGGAEKTAESGDYTRQLMKYLLWNEDEYGLAPIRYTGGSVPYYLQRRRRSLARHRLPHIHRRRRSGGKQLSRAKRTKRDLFDDELYYNPDAQLALQRAVDEEEAREEKQAEVEELLSYLVALYPALYNNNQLPPRGPGPYPGYLWYGSNHPEEEAYPEYPEMEEEADYEEVPAFVADVEPPPPSQLAPAWEPAFYPEEVEEQGYYPAPAKRQGFPGYPSLRPRLKRYFFPYSQEPYAHWGAFVPAQEKRGYGGAYRNLKDLAAVLDESRRPSPYIDAFTDYRKK